MKKLGKNLKRALAHQDASDYLSMEAKMKVLGYEGELEVRPSIVPHHIPTGRQDKL